MPYTCLIVCRMYVYNVSMSVCTYEGLFVRMYVSTYLFIHYYLYNCDMTTKYIISKISFVRLCNNHT